jgi:hypothetical protein
VMVQEVFGSSVGGVCRLETYVVGGVNCRKRTRSAWWLVPDQLKIFFRGSLAKGVSFAWLKWSFCWLRIAVSTPVASVMVFDTSATFGLSGLSTGTLIKEIPLDVLGFMLGS